MGAIVKLVNEENSSQELVINVEYNQLDSLLKSKGDGADVKNDEGYSHFPGNTNTLVFKLPEYYEKLTQTGGVIPEFVNPKYANEERTEFKSATRLECMMQDYPKLLSSAGEVGFTTYEPWYCFSPAKNNVKDAAACVAKGIPSYGAAEAEYNFYEWTNKMLELAGVEVERATEKSDFNGMKFAFGPKVLLDPKCAMTFAEIKQNFSGKCKIPAGSSLVLNDETKFENEQFGEELLVCTKNETLDTVKTKGAAIDFVLATPEDSEIYQIRGYKPQERQS
jgi:UDP-sugar pyrophosphorylase